VRLSIWQQSKICAPVAPDRFRPQAQMGRCGSALIGALSELARLRDRRKPTHNAHTLFCRFEAEGFWLHQTAPDDADMKSVAFDLNCNQPLKVEVSSLNGGLKHEAHSRLADYAGFTSFI